MSKLTTIYIRDRLIWPFAINVCLHNNHEDMGTARQTEERCPISLTERIHLDVFQLVSLLFFVINLPIRPETWL